MARIKVGSILKSRSGDLRVVRDVKHRVTTKGPWKGCRKVTVYLAIRRCSWTGRCYTVMNEGDLAYLGFSYTGARLKLGSDIDEKIAESIESGEYIVGCCDVRGVY